MNKLTQALMEELTVEYVKVGPLQIPESVVISWVIMVLVVLGSILLTRNLKVDHISKRQAVLEMAYTAGKNFFEGLLGKEGACYVPYLMTVAIYIACSNLIGVFGVKPPTKDLDVTAALALMSIVLIYVPLKDTVRSFAAIVDGEADDLPEWAFFNVGTLEDARQKAAEKMAEEKGGAV